MMVMMSFGDDDSGGGDSDEGDGGDDDDARFSAYPFMFTCVRPSLSLYNKFVSSW